MTKAAVLAALVLWAQPLRAAILEVPTDYATIQAAFAAGSDGDTVLLRRGLYHAPITPPIWSVTIAGEFLVTRDTMDIGATVVAPDSSNPWVRCVTATGAGGSPLRLIGLKLQNGQLNNENGGGLLVAGRAVELQHCRITKCVARYGGAIAVSGGSLVMKHCRLDHNRSTIRIGNILYLNQTTARVFDSRLGYSSGPVGEGADMEIRLDHASIYLTGCLITNIGWLNDLGSYLFRFERNLPAYEIAFRRCLITNCRLNSCFSFNDNSGVYNFSMDSSVVELNEIAQGLYIDSDGDSTYASRFVGNVFRQNIRPPGWGGMGLIVSTRPQRPMVIQGNLFLDNSFREWACSRFDAWAIAERDFSRNYYIGNRTHGFAVPPGGANIFAALAEDLFHHNIMDGNPGLAAFQPVFITPSSHCEHNYWGSSLGPYDSSRNPTSNGDSVNWRILFDPYEPDTSFLASDNENRYLGNSAHDFLIGFAYPNPFNSTVTIEFVATQSERLSLEIFDLTGRRVATVADEEFAIGIHHRTWNADANASGIYFARLSSASSSQQPWLAKLVLLK